MFNSNPSQHIWIDVNPTTCKQGLRKFMLVFMSSRSIKGSFGSGCTRFLAGYGTPVLNTGVYVPHKMNGP